MSWTRRTWTAVSLNPRTEPIRREREAPRPAWQAGGPLIIGHGTDQCMTLRQKLVMICAISARLAELRGKSIFPSRPDIRPEATAQDMDRSAQGEVVSPSAKLDRSLRTRVLLCYSSA